MSADWFTIETEEGLSLDKPGIYVWSIGGRPVYAGQSSDLSRRVGEYRRNIDRMDRGLPYRISDRDYRLIHRMLHEAKGQGKRITVAVVENCQTIQNLNEREQVWIANISQNAKRPTFETGTELARFLDRQHAHSRIVSETLDGRSPSDSDAQLYINGGATFWDEDHYLIAFGLHLPSIADEFEHQPSAGEWRSMLADYRDDIARVKFGSIPVSSLDGRSVVAISQFSWFYGDTLKGFYASEEAFRISVASEGWLLSGDRWMAEALSTIANANLLALASTPKPKTFRLQ